MIQAPAWGSAGVRLGAVLAVAATLCVLWWTGALADATEPERIRALLTDTGWLGPLLWWLAFVCLEPFGMPGAVFMIPASVVWPPALAIPMCVAGGTGAGVVAFVLARWIGPEVLVARLPERARRHTVHARERGFRTALVVRLLLFLFPPAHWALGISGIRFGPFVAGSALGFVPGMTVWVLATRELFQRLEHLPVWEGVALAVAALVLGAGVVWWRRRRVRTNEAVELRRK
jgi:uncharacterized membrane protein YdjX (TVP38/TMEM64 family)